MAGRSRRTDLRLGALDIDKFFSNANTNSDGKIELGSISTGSSSELLQNDTKVEVIDAETVGATIGSSIKFSVDGEQAMEFSANPSFVPPASTLTCMVGAHIIPPTNEDFDLGSPENKWRDLYLSANSIHLGDETISAASGRLSVGSNVLAHTNDIPTNETFIQAALADSNFVSFLTGP
jgi:hypothetical protein